MLKNTLAYIKNKQSLSVGFVFSIGSLLLGIMVAALPAIKTRLDFTEGSLGLSLLFGPAGSLAAVFASSKVFSRFAGGRALFTGCILQCLFYTTLVTAVNRPMFWTALFAIGFIGCLNGIASNSIVDNLEKTSGRKIMSTSHGMYSLGGGISAGLAALFNSFHLNPGIQVMLVAGVIISVLLAVRTQILSHTGFIHSSSSLAAPPASVMGLAFICFVTFMGEGCIADWSSIYLRESLNSTMAVASLGFAGFSLMMAIARLNGDALREVVKPEKIVMGGCLVAATGFSFVILFPYQSTAIMGFTIVGLGYSCIVPILFSAAANVPGLSPAMGIASISSGGLIGFLLGPALIGFIAEKSTLATGLSLVLVLSLVAVWAASQNKFLKGNFIQVSLQQ